jgi:hypothetical protein
MRALKIAGGVIAVLVVALIIFIATFDVSKYKGTIEAEAKAATGREVTIGDIRMAPSLTPAVTLSDFKIANAPWGTRPEMLTAKRVVVHTRLLPLLFGNVILTKLVVDDADGWLETDKSGKANWDLSQPGQSAQSTQSKPLNLDGIELTNAKLAYKDVQTGRDAEIAAKSIAVRFNGALQDMNVSKISVDNGMLTLKDGKETTQASIGKLALDAQGRITDVGLTNLAASDIKFSESGTGTPTDLVVEKVSLDKDGKLVLDAKLNGQDLKARGTVGPLTALAKLDKPFSAKLTVEGAGMKGAADVAIEIANKRPHIKGTVNVAEVDLAAFGNSSAKSNRLFSESPLPWDALRNADADVKVTLGKATLPDGITVTNVALPIVLTNGKLDLNPFSAALAGGTLNGSLAMNAADKSLALKSEAKGMTAEALAKEMKKGDLITGGPLTVDADIHGNGASLHDIAGSASGRFLLAMGEARIRTGSSGALSQITGALTRSNNGFTAAKCAVINLPLSSGVANVTNGIGIVTDQVEASATGNIDFRNERLDLSIHPKGGGVVGAGLGEIAQALKITGTLTNPSIGVDAAGAAKSIAGIGAGLATGGGATGLLGGALGNVLTGRGKDTRSSLLGQRGESANAPSGDPCQIARIGK